MIKINVISNNLKWKKYLSEPDLYIEKKIKKINKKENNYKKKNYLLHSIIIRG
tara:strand:- start:300 stop:458 length:159 start_codon:yes stop_codon:yes gene_type:complete